MPKAKTPKSKRGEVKNEVAQAARESELRDLVDRVETEKSGACAPQTKAPTTSSRGECATSNCFGAF